MSIISACSFFFKAPATTEIYTLSLHDALPILRGIIRARWEIDGYVLNLGLANSWFAGDEITFLPKAERDSFPWKEPLGAALQDIAEPVRQNDLARVRAEVEQIAGRRILTGLKGRRLGVRV